jgi:hypothetical protein
MVGSENRRIIVQVSLDKKQEILFRIIRTKRA